MMIHNKRWEVEVDTKAKDGRNTGYTATIDKTELLFFKDRIWRGGRMGRRRRGRKMGGIRVSECERCDMAGD